MTTFNLTDIPILGAECPAIPDGATRWERQEADRMWHEALGAYRELIGRLVHDHETLLVIDDGHQGGISTGSDAALLAKAHEAVGRLDGTLNGIKHRLALAVQANDDGSCSNVGPRIGDSFPHCVLPADHDGPHRPGAGWGRDLKDWT
jgi:hypothetical protein